MFDFSLFIFSPARDCCVVTQFKWAVGSIA